MSKSLSPNGDNPNGDGVPENPHSAAPAGNADRRLLPAVGAVVFSRGAISIVLVLGVLGLGRAAYEGLKNLKQPPPKRPPIVKVYTVEVLPVAPMDLPQEIIAHGTALPEIDVTVSARVSGKIVTTAETFPLLHVGQKVIPGGPLLLQIDPTTYRQQYEQAELKVKADEREIELTKLQQKNNAELVADASRDLAVYKAEYDRYRRAKQKGVAVDSELDRAKLELQRYQTVLTRAKNQQKLYPLQLQQLEIRKKQHETEREIAKTDLERTRIAAGFDGVIAEVKVQPGQFVKVGDPLVRIANADVVEIPMALSIEDCQRLWPQAAGAKSTAVQSPPRVRLAESEESLYQWEGRVVRVAPWADQLTRTIMVYVRVDNRSGAHRTKQPVIPGMHYVGRISAPKLDHVLAVPRDGILWDEGDDRMPDAASGNSPTAARTRDGRVFVATQLKQVTRDVGGSKRTVWEGIARPRKVAVGRRLNKLAVIESGLQTGDHVVLTNLDVLHDGAKVRFAPAQVHRLEDELPARE